MGEKDTTAKEYLANNERFADLCNYVLFGGKAVICADDLEERDTTEILSLLGVGNKEIKSQQKFRDILKRAIIKYTGQMCIVLIGVENQTEIHYAMPVKQMVYDALNYGSQVKEAAAKHKEKSEYGTSAEFLSGFYKDDHLTPVITITLYWGADEWDAPRSLHEMFGWIDEQAMNRLLKDQERLWSMDNESIATINTFLGTEIPYNDSEGGNNVCKAWDDHKESGRIEGRTEGRTQEIYASVRDGDYSAARGAEKLGITVAELEKRMEAAGYLLPLVK